MKGRPQDVVFWYPRLASARVQSQYLGLGDVRVFLFELTHLLIKWKSFTSNVWAIQVGALLTFFNLLKPMGERFFFFAHTEIVWANLSMGT